MCNSPGPESRKRKERDGPEPQAPKLATEPEPAPNRLLAAYLAHEFLTKGTLFGQRWDPSIAEAESASANGKRPSSDPLPADQEPAPMDPQAYGEVACLLKDDGAHIPGIINPTQLVQWFLT